MELVTSQSALHLFSVNFPLGGGGGVGGLGILGKHLEIDIWLPRLGFDFLTIYIQSTDVLILQ